MRPLVPAVLLAAITACAQQPAADVTQAGSPSPEATAALRAEVDRINEAFSRWVAAGHADSIASAYTADAFAAGPNQPPVMTRDSIAAMWASMSKFGKFTLTPRSVDLVLHGDYATERGTWEMKFERARNAPKEAPPSFTDRGSYVVLWVKEGDRWLLKWDLGTSSGPQAAAAR